MNTAALNVDARNRALRSFVQGLTIDVVVAIAAALLVWLPGADLSSKDAWIVIGITLAKTILQTAASYVMRRFVDASAIPTPLPPTPQPEPADPNPPQV
jgi:hypothetical protein